MDDTEVGRRIRAARGYAGLSQSELGKRVDLSEDRVAALEKGERRAHKWELWGIAEECDLSRSWFTDEWTNASVVEIERGLGTSGSTEQVDDDSGKSEAGG